MAISSVQVRSVPANAVRMQRAGGAAGSLLVNEPIERKIRVLLADDSSVVREALAHLLQLQADIEVVDQAADGLQAVQMASQLQPDVVVMDVNMPQLSGVEATRRIHNQLPQVRIIGLSMHNEEEIVAAMSDAGAVAYLTKTDPPSRLIAAIRQGAALSCRP
jgi:DNA-binding NarL/FixJ family response regulator